MKNVALFRTIWKDHGLIPAVVKALGRLAGSRVMVEGIDQDFPRPGVAPDLSMPTMEDARVSHASYPRWKHVLPLPNERMMIHIGAGTVENFFVVADAWGQVLNHYIQSDSHVMDIGCGCGRMARMLVGNPYVRHFTGVDVVVPYVEWCNRHFDEIYPGRFRFFHLDVRTERYNPNGTLTCKTARFPAVAAQADLIYAASLFTHLYPEDARCYLKEMRRVLKAQGKAIVSIHDQPRPGEAFSGTEHRADYDATHFLDMSRDEGFDLLEDIGDLCGQRTFVLRAKTESSL